MREHAAVGRDQAIPGLDVVTEREQQLIVIQSRHALVDLIDWNELRVSLEVGQDPDDWLWEVLIESEEARHGRARSCCEGRMEVLRKLSLEVQGILYRRRLDIGIQPVDLLLSKPAFGKRTERLRLEARVSYMR